MLLAMLTLTACPSDSEEDFLEASEKEITLKDGQAQVTIKSNTAWNITQLPSWISCSSMGGSGDILLRLTEIQKNPNTTERTGTMTVKCAGSATKVDIIIIQPGTPLPDDEISVNKRNVQFSASEGTDRITITANNLWSFTIEGGEGWLTLSLTPETQQRDREKEMELKAAQNSTVNTREATLTFTCGTAMPITVRVTQEKGGVTLNVKPEIIAIDCDGNGDNTFTVESNIGWTTNCSDTWCTLEIDGTTASGTYLGNKEVRVKVEKYDIPDINRQATITIKGEDNTSREVKVTQNAAPYRMEIDAASPLIFPANKDSKTFNISANTDWKIYISDEAKDWLSVSPLSGQGGSSPVAVTVMTTKENIEAKPRPTATITIRATGIANDKIIEVVQEAAGAILEVVPKEPFSFGPKGGKITLDITANIEWHVVASDSWIQPEVLMGEGSRKLNVEILPNMDATERSQGTITIISDDKHIIISVSQEGINLELNPNSLSFGKNGERKDLRINCNNDWEVVKWPDWCTVSSKLGSNNATIHLTAKANPSITEREEILTVKSGNVNKSITLKQEAQKVPGAEDNPLPGGYSRKTK